jgi:hypothetical protein
MKTKRPKKRKVLLPLYVPLLPYLLIPVLQTEPGGGLKATERRKRRGQTKTHEARQSLIKTHILGERLGCEAL